MKSLIKSMLRPFPSLEARARHWSYRWHNRIRFRRPRTTYSQFGEDLLLLSLMQWLGISNPTYLDVGAHHPTYLSNTYFFYRRGSRGVCVEPDPELFARIARRRTRDTNLNVGIGLGDVNEADFYVMSARGLNTFSREEAETNVKSGHRIEQVTRIRLEPINEIIRRYFSPWPNFVSMDVEGLDSSILKTLDFKTFRPEAFCIETLSPAELRKSNDVLQLMADNDYEIYADTFTNTIFVEGSRWRKARADLVKPPPPT
jgi:FkbM family methyltransferase